MAGKEAESVAKGDKIMFASSVGVDIEVNGQQFRLIPDELYIDAII
jgi:co-chaperonin GroES (HSP10)